MFGLLTRVTFAFYTVMLALSINIVAGLIWPRGKRDIT